MKILAHAATVAARPTVATSRAPDGAVIVRIESSPIEAPDELRPISAWAADWGLEFAGLRRALRRAGARHVRIGRAVCVRRSDVLALADTLASAPSAPAGDADVAYASLVRRAGGSR